MANKDLDVVEIVFEKCPVCKKGSVQFIHKKILFIFKKQDLVCNKCNARFKWEGKVSEEDTYSLDLSESNEEDKYNGQTLKRHEWENGISDFDYCVQNDILPKLEVRGLNIILQPSEICHWVTATELLEERAVRQTYGGAVRVMKGVYVGGSQGESHGALRKIDKGILLLTNQRLIFNGQLRSSEYKLDKIVSVEEWQNAIEIGASNRQKVQIFTCEAPNKGATFIRMAISHLGKPSKKVLEIIETKSKKSSEEIIEAYKRKKEKMGKLEGKPFSERLDKEMQIKMKMSPEEHTLHNYEHGEVYKLSNEAKELIKDHRYKEAEAKLKKATSIMKFGFLYCQLGDLYKKIEKYDNAIKVYKEAIKVEPDIPYPKRAIEIIERQLSKSKKK